MKDIYIKVFIGTMWDLFFIWQEMTSEEKGNESFPEYIKKHLSFLYDQQQRQFPNIKDMTNELFQNYHINKNITDVYSCQEKNSFTNKYYKLLKSN